MKKLCSVPSRLVKFAALALKNLKFLFSSNPIIVRYRTGDGERFFVANRMGRAFVTRRSGNYCFAIKLSNYPSMGVLLRWNLRKGNTVYFMYFENTETDFKAVVEPVKLLLWLALFWRVSFL